MSKNFVAFVAVLLSASSITLAQSSQDKSLGDVAREHKAQKEKQKKSGKVLNIADVSEESSVSSNEEDTAATSSPDRTVATSAAQSGSPKSAPNQTRDGNAHQSAVFDHSFDSKVEPLVVPAGTEIRVDLVEGKVIVPVRVGFATPIPALSKVTVQVNRTYYPTGLFNERRGYVGYSDYATLTAITIGSATYPVQANAVPVATPGSAGVTLDNSLGSSPHDAKFVLSAPVEIER